MRLGLLSACQKVLARVMKFPWETKSPDMHAGFSPSMRNDEFIAWLRYRATESGASPALINKFDDLYEVQVDVDAADYEQQIADAKEEMCSRCCHIVEREVNKIISLMRQEID
jgi:hypothetical protein